MTRELRNLTGAILFGFVLIAISSAYWSVFHHEGLAARSDNPRRVAADQDFPRGAIVDRNGLALAVSGYRVGSPYLQRIYPYEHVGSVTGYHSYQYGNTGLEAAFDDVLSGLPDERGAWETAWDNALNLTPQGYDLRSTIDLGVQQALGRALGNRHGAAIAVLVPSGEVLAMVSHPALDSNVIALNWDEFEAMADENQSPLLNRARRGVYQPGGVMQIVWLTMLLEADDSLQRSVQGGASVILPCVGSVMCLETPPSDMHLIDAFAYGCPQPFVEALPDLQEHWEALERLGFLSPPPLFRMQTEAPPQISDFQPTVFEAVGQGQVTVTPLQVARLLSAIANEGWAPLMTMADAYRVSEGAAWRAFDIPQQSTRLMSPIVADRLRQAMYYAADQVSIVSLAGVDYGYVATAYAGRPARQFAWFLGFDDLPDGSSLVVVVVVEDADGPVAALAAREAFRVAIPLLR